VAGAEGESAALPDAPGWYPDPWSATGDGERYFDGKHWGTTEKPLARHTRTTDETRSPGRGWRGGSGGGSGSARGWRRFLRPVAILVVLLIATGVVAALQYGAPDDGPSAAPTPTDRPPPSAEESAQPLGTPPNVPEGAGDFEVIQHQRGSKTTPVAWDPCRPVHYVVTPAGAPADGLSLVQDAIAEVSRATGLKFVYDGATVETPSKEREPFLPDLYGKDRWAPALISWSDETTFSALAGYIAGIGSPQAVYAKDGRMVYVTGEVVLDAKDLSPAAVSDRAVVKAIVLHELGHLVGLDHTADETQIMYSESQYNVRTCANGDRRGLALLGSQACFPDL
jgi:hypothetical protein